MDSNSCASCLGQIRNPGHGRRYCETCSPAKTSAGGMLPDPTCVHRIRMDQECEPCEWQRAFDGWASEFWGRLDCEFPWRSPWDPEYGVDRGADFDAAIADARRASRREVARLRRRTDISVIESG